MNEMIRYIFSVTQKTEDSVISINKATKRQKKFNAGILALSCYCIAWGVSMYKQNEDNKQRLTQLREEIDSLNGQYIKCKVKLDKLNAEKGEAKM